MRAITPRENEVLNTAITILQKRLDPDRILLFGSRAEGRSRVESDFDLAVDVAVPDFRVRWQIEESVNEAIGLYEADIVYLNSVEEPFRRLIEKTGKIIYEREKKRSIA